MSGRRATPLNPSFWVLLRMLPTSSANAKLRNWSITQGISSHQFVSSFHSCIPSKPMSHFLCKSIMSGNCSVTVRNIPNVFPLRWISSSSDQQSFAVSYLINSIGLSPESALSATKRVNFVTAEKPDKVINLFKKYGFSQTQLSRIFGNRPQLILADLEKSILPKLKFFESIGLSCPEIVKMLSVFPNVLTNSLDNQIMPAYDFFRDLFQSDEKVITAVKRFPDLLKHNIEKYVSPRVNILRGQGVPDSNIATLILNWPLCFMVSSERFRRVVEKVGDMGFDASKVNFVLAFVVLQTVDDSKWEMKVDAYKKWGWSEEDVLKAFRRHPWCMMLSEEKLTGGMDFFINKMGTRPCLLANHPKLLSLSLKKRLIPRLSVFEVLLSKGLVKKEVSLAGLFDSPEKKFLQKFVTPYKNDAPELLKLYKEKLNLCNGPLVDEV